MNVGNILIFFLLCVIVAFLWVLSIWIAYDKGRRQGYSECLSNLRKNRKFRKRKKKLDISNNISVISSDEEKHTESETVRVVATRPGEDGFWSNNGQ